MYNSVLSLTSTLDKGGCLKPCSDRFTPRNDPVPVVQKAGSAARPVGAGTENLFHHRDSIFEPSNP